MENNDVLAKEILSVLNNALKSVGPDRVPKDELYRRFKGRATEGEIETLIKLEYIRETTEKFVGRPFSYLEITGKGLEFLEGGLQLQQIIVYGDHYTVSMGDNNSNVVIGRDNTQIDVQFGLNTNLEDAVASVKRLAQSKLSSEPELDEVLHLLDNLQYELSREAVDSEAVEDIRQKLFQQGGEIGATISVLFNTPIVKQAIGEAN